MDGHGGAELLDDDGAGDLLAGQQVEWVNLRVTGVGPIRRPELRSVSPGSGAETARTGSRDVYVDGYRNIIVTREQP